MASMECQELEQHIISVMQRTRLFQYRNQLMETLLVGKPRPHDLGGECKTDVFVRIHNKTTGETFDEKISVKTEGSHEFEGNKATAKIAEDYFGRDWENIIISATTSLSYEFERTPLIYAREFRRTKANSITVGWKLEFTNRPRRLSTPIPLSDQQVRDYIYKGTNQAQSKIDAYVEGRRIRNSGIADYLLVTTEDQINCPQDVLDQSILIDDARIGTTYMAFTANNYRTDVMKADGPRALAVRIEWEADNGKLIPKFHYDHPLKYTGERDMAPLVRHALQLLGKRNASEIRPDYDLINPDIYNGD